VKIYNYLLFRLYSILSKNNTYGNKEIDFLISLFSTFIILYSLQISFYTLDYYFSATSYKQNISKNFFALIYFVFGYINYHFFIRKRKFLNYGFKEDKKGGYYIIVFIIILATTSIVIANRNREKIIAENKERN